MNYYNEHDETAAAWLRELIKAGHIPPGDVDTRSICDVKPSELSGYTQCHFFAGIGGWSLALRYAGWPPNKRVWTGSCPCQPFSSAGNQLGELDERHLWPVFFNLIRECRPDIVFGEQVANAIRKGWLDGVQADLEGENYACGSVVLGAHSVGAPHKRQRLYWGAVRLEPVAVSNREQLDGSRGARGGSAESANNRLMGYAIKQGLEGLSGDGDDGHQSGRLHAFEAGSTAEAGAASGVGFASSGRLQGESKQSGNGAEAPEQREANFIGSGSSLRAGDMADTGRAGDERGERRGETHGAHEENGGEAQQRERGRLNAGDCGSTGNFWSDFDLVYCTDGKARRIEPGTFPLAHGVSGRVGLLRGWGNAIVTQTAATFIQEFLESIASLK